MCLSVQGELYYVGVKTVDFLFSYKHWLIRVPSVSIGTYTKSYIQAACTQGENGAERRDFLNKYSFKPYNLFQTWWKDNKKNVIQGSRVYDSLTFTNMWEKDLWYLKKNAWLAWKTKQFVLFYIQSFFPMPCPSGPQIQSLLLRKILHCTKF